MAMAITPTTIEETVMKNLRTLMIAATIYMILTANSFADDTHSGRALGESGRTSSHASASTAHSFAGSGQAVSAVSAVPFYVSGTIGAVSNEVAVDLMDAATAPIGTPLIITDESVITGPPPNDALKENR
jgi:hypothetical protein